jgi:hypothetical protein
LKIFQKTGFWVRVQNRVRVRLISDGFFIFLLSVVQNLNPRIYFNSPIKDGGFLNPGLNLILELIK